MIELESEAMAEHESRHIRQDDGQPVVRRRRLGPEAVEHVVVIAALRLWGLRWRGVSLSGLVDGRRDGLLLLRALFLRHGDDVAPRVEQGVLEDAPFVLDFRDAVELLGRIPKLERNHALKTRVQERRCPRVRLELLVHVVKCVRVWY